MICKDSEVTSSMCENDEIRSTAMRLLEEHDYNTVAISEVCGHVVGHDPLYLDKFCAAFVESFFASQRICDRIDYFHLNDLTNVHLNDPEMVKNSLSWGMRDGAFYISDLSHRYADLNLVLLRQTEGDISSYAVRWYNNPQPLVPLDPRADLTKVIGKTKVWDDREFCHCLEDCQDVYWNFRRCSCGCGVQLLYPSEGVMNPRLTRMSGYFIKWASNVLGFDGCRKA